MSVLQNNPFLLASGNPTDPTFPVQRSVRMRSSASAYFNRTPASAGNRTTWTWSGWVKRGKIDSSGTQYFLLSNNSANNDTGSTFIYFYQDYLRFTGFNTSWRQTGQVFRDPSAWYHIVINWDTTQATASNRIKIYVNGSQVTSFLTSNDPALNATGGMNAATATYMGADVYFGPANFFDGYITELNFIDGQSLTPSSFGGYNSGTGVWEPRKYSGTYGTNGFYLNFQDNSGATATTIGKDSSGNSNNWTPNNISVTAGTTYDSMLDVPTNTSPTNANFCTWNPLVSSAATYSNANLQFASTSTQSWISPTIGIDSGKFYWEETVSVISGSILHIGATQLNGATTESALIARTYYADGNKYSFNTGSIAGTAFGSSYTTNDVIGVAIDMSAGKIWFSKNGTFQGSGNPSAGTNEAYSGLTGVWGPFAGKAAVGNNPTVILNCGQRPFTYTPPTGFVALNTFNLPDPIIANGKKHFDIITWTGDGTTGRTLSGLQFQPDFVFAKARDLATGNPLVMDSVRGSSKSVLSNSTSTELTDRGMGSFNSNGFTLDSQTATRDEINPSTKGMVGWNWKAGGTAVSNTSGSITSSVSANQTAGFSIVSFTGVPFNSSVHTIGHGLGVAPRFYIVKNRDVTDDFYCYHASLGATTRISLNTTAAATGSAGIWGSTAPTSLVFSLVGNAMSLSSANRLIAYCFSEISGYSKFGIYTGNGSLSGPFIYLGFRPRYVLLKRTDTAGYDWWIYDTERNQINSTSLRLTTNSAVVEAGTNGIDILANGFRQTQTDISVNASGGTYIYAAFAENPFKYSLAR
jgi:hypothetical protein